MMNISGIAIMLIGRYGGHDWHGFLVQGLDAWKAFPPSTCLWLAGLGSKHKSWAKQTNIQVIENNHAMFLGSTNDLILRILSLWANKKER